MFSICHKFRLEAQEFFTGFNIRFIDFALIANNYSVKDEWNYVNPMLFSLLLLIFNDL